MYIPQAVGDRPCILSWLRHIHHPIPLSLVTKIQVKQTRSTRLSNFLGLLASHLISSRYASLQPHDRLGVLINDVTDTHRGGDLQ